MSGRISRWYAATSVVGVVLVFAWVRVAGFGGAVFQVDWRFAPHLEGAEVVIDGASAGTLQMRRNVPLTGFRVALGTHVIEIRHPDYGAEPDTVATELRGVQVLRYASTGSRREADGTRVRFTRLTRREPE